MINGRVLTIVGCVAIVGLVLWAWPDQHEAESAVIPTTLIAPNGTLWWHGDVYLTEATPLAALYEASRQAGLVVEVASYGGVGDCASVYVTKIGGVGPDGSLGWVYDVRNSPTDSWHAPPISADCMRLQDGDFVRWRWGTE